MNYVSSRLSVVKPSASMAVSQAAKALRTKGVDVIDLSLGEPDFLTPKHIIEAAFEAAKAGQTLYTAATGTPEVREAIAGKFRRENGLDYKADDIVVANGDTAVADYLLNDGHVASVPGAAYGLSPYFRISTATSEELLTEAIRRITDVVAQMG
jgi:aspartate/methionine/tyrosine aminotransferase